MKKKKHAPRLLYVVAGTTPEVKNSSFHLHWPADTQLRAHVNSRPRYIHSEYYRAKARKTKVPSWVYKLKGVRYLWLRARARNYARRMAETRRRLCIPTFQDLDSYEIWD